MKRYFMILVMELRLVKEKNKHLLEMLIFEINLRYFHLLL